MAALPYPEAARALLRDTLLDATGDLLRDRAWAQVTMADVARAAGVSRQTLYNEFGGRRELARAYVLREADRLLTDVEEVIERHAPDARAALQAAFAAFQERASATALVAAIAGRDGGDELLALVTVQGGELLGAATQRLSGALERTWPRLDPSDTRVAAELLVRLAISHAALPAADPARAATDIASVLGPFVDGALGLRPLAEAEAPLPRGA